MHAVNSWFKKDLKLQIHLHKAFFSDDRFLDSLHKFFLNQTTLNLRKKKWTLLNREFVVVKANYYVINYLDVSIWSLSVWSSSCSIFASGSRLAYSVTLNSKSWNVRIWLLAFHGQLCSGKLVPFLQIWISKKKHII